MLRSKYAADDVPTEVELIFAYGGKEYTVRRNPEYQRPSKRGGGIVTQKADAQLTYPDGNIVTKTKDVTAAVESILGVNRNQFTQIAMIAQGNFETAFGAHRRSEEDFSQDFQDGVVPGTAGSPQIGIRKAVTAAEEIKNSIGQYIDGLEIEENEELLKNAKDSDILLADLIGKVDDVIASDQAEQDKIEGDIAKIEKRLTQVNVDLGKAEEVERTEVAPARGEFRFGERRRDCSFFWQSMKQSRSGSQSSPLCASRSLWRRMNCPDTMSLTRCEKNWMPGEMRLRRHWTRERSRRICRINVHCC